MNNTTQQDDGNPDDKQRLSSLQPAPPSSSPSPRCPPPPLLLLNATTLNVTDTYNVTRDCYQDSADSPRTQSRRVKTYHMQPRLYDDSLAFYAKYDPATGVRTAAILGSCLFLVVFYGLYKTKCRKKEWTSQDEMFVENYKKRFNGRKGRRGTDFAFMREPFHRSGEPSIAMEQTAKWIQSQPLHGSVQKNNFKSTMGNLCMDSFKASMYPVCDTNNINQLPNGKTKEPKQDEIQRLNERNLKLDLQVAYKDMFPCKQNLWKSRSYDDKVNMQAISSTGSICPDPAGELSDPESSVGATGVTRYPLSPQIIASSRKGASLSSDGGVSLAASPLPMLQQLSTPSHTSLTSLTLTPSHNHHKHHHHHRTRHASLIPRIDADDCDGGGPAHHVAAFHIGTPSSCSSLDHDECFSITSSSIAMPLTLIPPIPPYVPPRDTVVNVEPADNDQNESEHNQNQTSTTKL